MLSRVNHPGEDWGNYQDLFETRSGVLLQENQNQLKNFLQLLFHGPHDQPLHILEIGCGDGTISEMVSSLLKPSQITFTLVEPQASLGQRARDRLMQKGIPTIWIRKVAEKYFPTDEKFDLILCIRVVHHLIDPKNVTAGMIKALTPGGGLYLYDLLRPKSEAELTRWLKRRAQMLDHPSTQVMAESCLRASYSETEARQLLTDISGCFIITEDWFKRWCFTFVKER